MSTTPSDEEVVQRVRDGDLESYGLLATRHYQGLRRLAYRFLRDAAEAEDAVQTAHILALRHFGQYEGRCPYRYWMASITMNEVRARHRRRHAGVFEELRDCHRSGAPNPEQLAMRHDIRQLVDKALDGMPREYSIVFRLRELAELSNAETSRRLGLTETCVKTRLHRARAMLRRTLETQLGNRGQAAVRGPAASRSSIM